MADRLANMFGTEKDKVNCPFYFKIGACRHGDRCSRIHNKPAMSQTLIFHNMYINPTSVAVAVDGGSLEVDDVEAQQHYDEFYEDVFTELGNFGEIEELHVTANLGDHLSGNLYVKYSKEEEAVAAISKLQGRFYAGRPIIGEFSPVTDFREARCRQYDIGECTRGGFCNFIHECRPSKTLERDLYRRQRKKFSKQSRSRSRSRSPSRRSDRRGPERSPRRENRDDRDGHRRENRGERERERERDKDKDRESGRERDRERNDKGREYNRDREIDRRREGENERDKLKTYTSSSSREKERERENEIHNEIV